MKKVQQTGVYCIRNKRNGKRYVGGAYTSLTNRIRSYQKNLPKGRCHNRHLQAAWVKYGAEAFTFRVLERCAARLVKRWEQYWIDYHDAANPAKGYNICPRADSCLGMKLTEEAKSKISKAAAEQWEDEEFRAIVVAKNREAANDQFSDPKRRARHKRSMAKWMDENRDKQVARNKSLSNRRKVSETLMGHPVSQEMREKISGTLNRRIANGEVRIVSGEDLPQSKLTEEIVRCIRRRPYYHGLFADLARTYKVSDAVIKAAYRGTSWKHVPMSDAVVARRSVG